MELEIVLPDLRLLDSLSAELIACSVWEDERPFGALAGLLDWRFGGRLSALAKQSFVRGETLETILVPGRPRVPFEKVLIVGLGKRSAFGEQTFRDAIDRLLSAMRGLKVRRAVVELPGRGHGAIDPERATELLLERSMGSEHHDAWWLVEDADSEKIVRAKALDAARQARRARGGSQGDE